MLTTHARVKCEILGRVGYLLQKTKKCPKDWLVGAWEMCKIMVIAMAITLIVANINVGYDYGYNSVYVTYWDYTFTRARHINPSQLVSVGRKQIR